MALETKVLLQSQLDYAVSIRDKRMYKYIARMLAVENIKTLEYEEAVREFEDDEK